MEKDDKLKLWDVAGAMEGLGVTSTYSNHVIYNIPEVNLTLTSIVVKAETTKLQTEFQREWTPSLERMTCFQPNDENSDFLQFFKEQEERKRIKKQRYKDRKKYIKMIEEWSGEKVNNPK